MKTIYNFISEKLILNKQTSVTNQPELQFNQWVKQIIKDFDLNSHRLNYSYMPNDITFLMTQRNKDLENLKTQDLRLIKLDPLPEYCEEACKNILEKNTSLLDLTTVYKDNDWVNIVNIYYLYCDGKNIILIVRFDDLLDGEDQYNAYEIYKK